MSDSCYNGTVVVVVVKRCRGYGVQQLRRLVHSARELSALVRARRCRRTPWLQFTQVPTLPQWSQKLLLQTVCAERRVRALDIGLLRKVLIAVVLFSILIVLFQAIVVRQLKYKICFSVPSTELFKPCRKLPLPS